jgi:hypothetical protein
MTNYEKFVTNYHRYQYAPRSMSEAFRDADYGTAIWRCEKPHGWRYETLVEFVVLMATMFFLGLFVAPILS